MARVSHAAASSSCIIFPHIPKTGGTSLKSQLEASNLKLFLDYDHPPHTRPLPAAACQRKNDESALLDFGNFDLVFGHFPIQRYQRPNYKYIALLRHPLDRAVSHYFYWKNINEQNVIALHRYPMIHKIKDGTMTFIQFLRQASVVDIYQRILSPLQPDDFLLVGFTEQYDIFTGRLAEQLGVTLQTDVHMRKGTREELPANDLRKATAILDDEIKLYQTYREHWAASS